MDDDIEEFSDASQSSQAMSVVAPSLLPAVTNAVEVLPSNRGGSSKKDFRVSFRQNDSVIGSLSTSSAERSVVPPVVIQRAQRAETPALETQQRSVGPTLESLQRSLAPLTPDAHLHPPSTESAREAGVLRPPPSLSAVRSLPHAFAAPLVNVGDPPRSVLSSVGRRFSHPPGRSVAHPSSL